MEDELMGKYQGALLGLAIGDALGVPVEFKATNSFEPVTDFMDSDNFALPAGHWSDDTAMALCLANSLVEMRGFDPIDQMEKYKRWFHAGYCSSTGNAVGVGQTVLRALMCHQDGDTPYQVVSRHQSDGNGSLMRLAPIPLFFRDNPKHAMGCAALSSRVTHGSPLSADACRYYTGLIIGALNGVPKEEILSDSYSPVPGFWRTNGLAGEVSEVARGSFKGNGPPHICGSGYVVKSMEAALWAFHSSESFEEGVLKAVNLGDDADTTGAIYGQLAGAYYGVQGIPERWLNRVAKSGELFEISNALFDISVGAYR